jgi:uncharacterized spore protein YtfJ
MMSEQKQLDEENIQANTIAVEVVERTMERFFDRADVKLVYGRPIRQGDTTIIPAAEVTVVTGFGAGIGLGGGMQNEGGAANGGAGGGGGTTSARPVAVIVASPDGVRVEPVLDLTKIGLAVITAWGFMLSMFLRIRRRK